MHEMGIAMQIIEIATNAVPEDSRPVRVEKIHLNVSMASCIVPDNLRLCFEMAAEKTILSGATLEIMGIPLLVRCNSCAHQWAIDRPVFECEQCGSSDIEVSAIPEIELVSIEVADD